MKSHQVIVYGKPILCSKCGLPGRTLVKDGKDDYCHSDTDPKCKLLATARRLKK